MFALNSLVIEIIVMSSVMNADTFRKPETYSSVKPDTNQLCQNRQLSQACLVLLYRFLHYTQSAVGFYILVLIFYNRKNF